MVSEVIVSKAPYSQSSGEAEDADDDDSASEKSENGYGDVIALRSDGVQEDPPVFGNVSVINSNDIHFGNKTFYQGPVTIKQFLYPEKSAISDSNDIVCDKEVVLDATAIPNGYHNPAFNSNESHYATVGTEKRCEETDSMVLTGLRRIQTFIEENFSIVVSLLTALLVFLTILMVIFLVKNNSVSGTEDKTKPSISRTGDSHEQEIGTPIGAPIDPSLNLTLPGKLKLVSRLEWVAQPPVQPGSPLILPVPYVIIMHTATENCSSQSQCVFHVRFIQTFHIESRQWWDIGYNFLVGGNGEAYEGRGWKTEGAHTYGYNFQSIGIAFIGTFNTLKAPVQQILACKRLIQQGVEKGYISPDYKLLGARQLQTTQSPGNTLFKEIQTWPHWAEKP